MNEIRPSRIGLIAAATCLLGVASTASAATLPVHGVLRSEAGGPVADGTYVLVTSLYDTADAKLPVWEELHNNVVVQLGFFHVVLGEKTPMADGLLTSDKAVWVGVQVGGEKELPRMPLTPVARAWYAQVAGAGAFAYAASTEPGGAATSLACTGCIDATMIATNAIENKHVAFTYAGSSSKGGAAKEADHALVADDAKHAADADLATKAGSAASAEELTCSGCVGLGHLADQTKLAFLSSQGGTLVGPLEATKGVDLAGSTLSGANLGAADPAIAPCTVKEKGRLASNPSGDGLLYCTGVAWKKVKLCGGDCKNAVEVACGQPLPDDCGDLGGCPGTGELCASGAFCDGSKCVGPGEAKAAAQSSCKVILAKSAKAPDGVYWLDTTGGNTDDAFEAYCDMTTDGGGWTWLGTVAGHDGQSWNTEIGYWGNTATLGDVDKPWNDMKSEAWNSLDTSKAEILYKRRYDGTVRGIARLANPCMNGKTTFRALFQGWTESLKCAASQITVIQAAKDSAGLSSASYQEGAVSGLGGSGTNGICWYGGDSSNNRFKGHFGWTTIGEPCYSPGHQSYIGVFWKDDAQYSQTDIDTTNWLHGTDTTKTEIAFFAR